jgi:hypothetical protein
LVELQLADVVAPDVDLAAHAKAMRAALGDGFIRSCEKLDDTQVVCALSANSPMAASACGGPTATR